MRRWPVLAVTVALAMLPPAAAQMVRPTDDVYAQVQQAFLGEQFARVVDLVGPLRSAGAGSIEAYAGPSDIARRGRVWLWYALSLERLQRTPDALQELDQLQEHLLAVAASRNVPREPAALDRFTDGLWPEVLFWDGEVSRRGYQMMRARHAYQRVVSGFPSSTWRMQAQLGLAFVLFHQQAYEEALREARQVWHARPGGNVMRQARLLEGLSALQLKDCETARGAFEELARTAPDRATVSQMAFYLGEALSGLSRFSEATRAYLRAMDADPGSSWARLARFGLGWSAFQQRQCPLCVDIFGHSATGDPSWPRPEFWFAQGQCLLELQDDAAAQDRFERLLKAAPDHPLAVDAALSLADVLARRNRPDDAQALLRPLLSRRLTPEQTQRLVLRMGSLLLAAGQAEAATAQFAQALASADPAVRQAALNGQGDAQLFLGQVDAAARAYEQARDVDPRRDTGSYAAYQLGRIHLQCGRLKEAIEAFRTVANQAGTALSADARLALAFAYLSNRQPDLARVELDVVRQRDPAGPHAARASYYLALLAIREGRVDEAQQLCRVAIERVPSSDEAVEAQLLLADLTASRRSPDDGLALLRQAMAQAEGPLRLSVLQRGRIAKKMGDLSMEAADYAAALARYEQARAWLPGRQGELDYQMASCYEEAGDLDVAIARYQAIAQPPWAVRGQLAAAKLLERQERWPAARAMYRKVVGESVPEAKIAEERLAALPADKPAAASKRRR